MTLVVLAFVEPRDHQRRGRGSGRWCRALERRTKSKMNGPMRKGVQLGVVLDEPRPRMVAVAEDHGDAREEATGDGVLAGPSFDAVEHQRDARGGPAEKRQQLHEMNVPDEIARPARVLIVAMTAPASTLPAYWSVSASFTAVTDDASPRLTASGLDAADHCSVE
jgi:hypothetical protein